MEVKINRFKVVILLLIVITILLLVSVILIKEYNPLKQIEEDYEVYSQDYKDETILTEDSNNITDPLSEEEITIKGELYFVIDDVGNNLFQLKPFLKLPMNLTFAVLPGLKYTKESVDLIIKAGKDYIIHQPMEPVGTQNPGPGVLLVGMNQDQVRTIVVNNLKDYYNVKGMNNHMGSAGTADLTLMQILFSVLREQDMYFLDSRTTSKSKGRDAAISVGISFAERSIFLDNSKEKQAILEAVENGLNVSEKKGHAIMIGHIWTEELADILLELYPALLENNYALNNLTELFTGNEFDEDTWY
jgi:uncharacterized protein